MPDSPLPANSFHTTRWTRVCVAKADSEDGRQALSDLCAAYYEPVVAFLRCELRDADTAREMAHAFFAQMLDGGAISAADPARGRFRSYLLGAVKHFLSHQREAWQRKKRGGGAEHLILDPDDSLQIPDRGQRSPDDEFDRQWAVAVLRQALESLKHEYETDGKGELLEKLQPWLTGDAVQGDQTGLAASLGININTLKSHIHRLKLRFRHHVKSAIASTLSDTAFVEDELEILFASLRRK